MELNSALSSLDRLPLRLRLWKCSCGLCHLPWSSRVSSLWQENHPGFPHSHFIFIPRRMAGGRCPAKQPWRQSRPCRAAHQASRGAGW